MMCMYLIRECTHTYIHTCIHTYTHVSVYVQTSATGKLRPKESKKLSAATWEPLVAASASQPNALDFRTPADPGFNRQTKQAQIQRVCLTISQDLMRHELESLCPGPPFFPHSYPFSTSKKNGNFCVRDLEQSILWGYGGHRVRSLLTLSVVVMVVTSEALQDLSSGYEPNDRQLCRGGHKEARGSTATS